MSIATNPVFSFGFRSPAAAGGGGYQPLSFADNFNRADGEIGNDWVDAKTWAASWTTAAGTINANRYKETAAGSNPAGYARDIQILDSIQEIDFAAESSPNAPDGIMLFSRMQADGSCYLGYINRSAGYAGVFYMNSAGSFISISGSQNGGTILLPGDKLRFKTEGDVLTWERIREGVATLIFERTAMQDLGAGRCGFATESARGVFDNYSLEEIAVELPEAPSGWTVTLVNV